MIGVGQAFWRARWCTSALLALWSMWISSAHAQPQILRVGGDACQFSSIQAAIDAAAANPGPDTIRVAMSATYSAQALKIGAQELTVIGGFATCTTDIQTPGARTIISGLGGAQDSVIEIIGDANRTLSSLLVRDGDETDARAGGGIDFAGGGILGLTQVVIAQNRAGYGGGISFKGSTSGAPAALILSSDVVVQNNLARNSGGGVRIEGNATLFMSSPRSTITGNEALGIATDSGYGGGLQVLPPAAAEIGSPGFLNFGVVSGNRAKYGGGIAISARDDGDLDGYVLLYSTDANSPVRVDHNIASVAGGGIYLDTNRDLTANEPTFLCAYEFRIDHNQAPSGAAVYLGNDVSLGQAHGALADFNVADSETNFRCGVGALPPRPSAQTCAPGVACNLIDANVVAQADGAPADGAIVRLTEDADMRVNRVTWRDNRGSDVIHGQTSDRLALGNCAFLGNTVSGRIIASDARIDMSGCTFAGNQVGLLDALSLTGESVSIQQSIIWQPGHVALGANHGPLQGSHILTNDPGSIPLPNTFSLDPRFVDPGRGDFRLRAASPAIDAGTPSFEFGQGKDLDGGNRHVDLAHPNGLGPRDLGAYERQDLHPILLNGEFAVDLQHWNAIGPNVSRIDTGALLIDWQGPGPIVFSQLEPRGQCVHLPIAGQYRLLGEARVDTANGNADTATLRWEFRRDGGEACNNGPPDSGGDLLISNGLDGNWQSAFTGINANEFTRNSSITVYTKLDNGGVGTIIRGWFDHIDLILDSGEIFKNSFE